MEQISILSTKYFILLVALFIWSIPWKGFALWKSARREEKIWFIIFLLINTAGVLEILYIFFLSDKNNTSAQAPSRRPVV